MFSLCISCVSEAVSVHCDQWLNISVPLFSVKIFLLSCTWWMYATREDSRMFSVKRCFHVLTRKVITRVLQSWNYCTDLWKKLSVIFGEASIPFIFRPSMSIGTVYFKYIYIYIFLIMILEGALGPFFSSVFVGCSCLLLWMNFLCWDLCSI